MFSSNYNRLLALEEELLKQKKVVKHSQNHQFQTKLLNNDKLSESQPDFSYSNQLLALEQELILQRRNAKPEYQIKENKKYQRIAKMLNYEHSANNKILELQQSLSKVSCNKQKRQKRNHKKSRSQKAQAMTFDYNEAIEIQYQGDSFAASLDYTTTEQTDFDLDNDISTIEVESFEVEENNHQTPEKIIPEVLPPASQEDTESFETEIQAILSGAKVYEPKQPKKTDTSSLSQTKNNNQQTNTPKLQPPSPQPQTENPHAIFDKIAQNMAYANSFDLGTISLEKRFDEFDSLLDAQESKALTLKPSQSTEENHLVELNYADFEHDLALMNETIPIHSIQLGKQVFNNFTANPIKFLGNKKLKIQTINPDTSKYTSQTINVRVQEKDNSPDLITESIELYELPNSTATRDIYLVENVDNSYIFQPTATNKATEFKTYFLPWSSGKAYMLELADKADYFLTPNLNGCCLMINGTRQNPVVIHANYDSPRLSLDIEGMSFEEQIAAYRKHQLKQYTRFYGNMAHQLIDDNIFDSQAATSILDPEFYLSRAGLASVFGIRKNGEWTFYYNLQKANQNITAELWPNLVL
ncbi:MAG: hypothetical protein ACFB2X_06825 [Rivularia sp. (in: cyanobacteria)]